jgi:hypothetical protein
VPAKSIRHVSWTGTWVTAVTHTITFLGASGVTATAFNSFLGVDTGSGFVAKGTSGWRLISVDLTQQPGYSLSFPQVFGRSTTGIATWISIGSCEESEA